jgi:hypothetical protein
VELGLGGRLATVREALQKILVDRDGLLEVAADLCWPALEKTRVRSETTATPTNNFVFMVRPSSWPISMREYRRAARRLLEAWTPVP